jgi:hypothetical protein
MKPRTLSLIVLLAASGLLSLGQNSSPWQPVTQHPQLQYRVKCEREAATIEWRNGYPGALTLKASVRGSEWDSMEDVTVAPGGSGQTELETMFCSPSAFRITVTRFSMAPPPPPPPSHPASSVAAKADVGNPPPPPLVAPYEPPEKDLPEVPSELVASVKAGMKREEVLQKLGPPASKLTIPEDHEFIETFRYRVAQERSSVIRFSNGVVTDITTR